MYHPGAAGVGVGRACTLKTAWTRAVMGRSTSRCELSNA